jgi:hypothetical protein
MHRQVFSRLIVELHHVICSFAGMADHNGSWRMGSFFKCDKLEKSNIVKKGNNMLAKEVKMDGKAS